MLGLDVLSHAATLTRGHGRRSSRRSAIGRAGSNACAGGARAPRPPPLAAGRSGCARRGQPRGAPGGRTRHRGTTHADAPEAARLATLPLLERLDDADRLIRLSALRTLGALRDPRAIPAPGSDRFDVSSRWGSVRPSSARRPSTRSARLPWEAARRSRRWSGLPGIDRSTSSPGTPTWRSARFATPAAVAALIAALSVPPVPEEAKQGLLHAGQPAVGALLGEVARGTPSSAVMAAALLGDIGDRRSTER